MGIREWFVGEKASTNIPEKATIDINYTPSFGDNSLLETLTEQFKGQVENKPVKFPKELGEEHPFDFCILEKLYKEFGYFTAVVDKYVDFVVGPGFYIECTDDKAKTIIEQFMKDVNFDTILRTWTKEALIKGNGFLELGGSKSEGVKGLKVLNANYMYVQRDKQGKILGYNQFTGAFEKFAVQKTIPFTTDQIAHIPFNIIGDCAYGQGIGYCSLKAVENFLQNEKDAHMIVNRKANSPLHAQLGKVEGDIKIIPKPEDVTAFGQKMEIMKNKTDWATDPLVNFKVIDFGNVGEKFTGILEHDLQMLMYIYQIPPELMGLANIPEGMAVVRMDAFERRIQSIQAELEKVIENNVFKRILNANGLEVEVEFQWGRPSNAEKNERLVRLKELMNNPRTSDVLYKMMEEDVVKILGYSEEDYELEIKGEEEMKKRELETSQPIVPGQNANPPQKVLPKAEQPKQPKPQEETKISIKEKLRKVKRKSLIPDTKLTEEVKESRVYNPTKKRKEEEVKSRNYEYRKPCPHCHESIENIEDIQEWLGFNYKQYLGQIKAVLAGYDFNNIKALTEVEREAGYLTETQVEVVRSVLDKGIDKGSSIKEMAKQIDKKADLKDLYRMNEDGNIKTGASGLPILAKSAEKRSIGIVRSELTRISNLGAEQFYKENNITKERWVASYGDRTCPDCEALNNQIFEIYNHPEIPLHPNCRCTLVALEGVK